MKVVQWQNTSPVPGINSEASAERLLENVWQHESTTLCKNMPLDFEILSYRTDLVKIPSTLVTGRIESETLHLSKNIRICSIFKWGWGCQGLSKHRGKRLQTKAYEKLNEFKKKFVTIRLLRWKIGGYQLIGFGGRHSDLSAKWNIISIRDSCLLDYIRRVSVQ